jgi:hypothetical protein
MKTHIHRIDITCDGCGKIDVLGNTKEVVMSYGRKAWASDLCSACLKTVEDSMTKLGMGGPQARKLPGTPDTAKGTAAPAKKQAVKSSVNLGKAKGQTYKGRKCRGCNHSFDNERGRRLHNTRTNCV